MLGIIVFAVFTVSKLNEQAVGYPWYCYNSIACCHLKVHYVDELKFEVNLSFFQVDDR